MNPRAVRAMQTSLRALNTNPNAFAMLDRTLQVIRESQDAIKRTDKLIVSLSEVYCGLPNYRPVCAGQGKQPILPDSRLGC